MVQFTELSLPKFMLESLEAINYKEATQIQSEAIPLALEGKDILASSQTGSGKTAAFAIPLVSRIVEAKTNSLPKVRGVIIAPTRELASQIKNVINQICGANVKTVCVFGGADITRQTMLLRKNPDIVIATPGRLQDHISRKNIDLSRFNVLILDEFDRMLDMGFKEEINKIILTLPKERQTLMFSATTRKSVIEQAKTYLIDPKLIFINPEKTTHENIKQEFIHTSHDKKYDVLVKELDSREGSILIFVNTKQESKDIQDQLYRDGYKSDLIHGDLRQRQRERTIKFFREEKFRILIATDVVARGIDITHIKHVINYDTPRALEDYTHRIGRTGRSGSEGFAVCFVTPRDKKFYYNIIRSVNSDDAESPAYNRKQGDFPRRSNDKNNRRYNTRNSSNNDRRYNSNRSDSNNERGSSYGNDYRDGGNNERSYKQGGEGKYSAKPNNKFNSTRKYKEKSNYSN